MPKQTDGRAKGPRMIQEILRLRALGLSKRRIAKALSCSRNTVDRYVEAGGEGAAAPAAAGQDYRAPWSEMVDWQEVHAATAKGDPLSALWEERVAARTETAAVPYVSFWREYRRRFPHVPLELHKIHPPGERCEIDYKGDAPGLGYIDRRTKEFVPCRLFGAVLCFSQLFFPRATLTERQHDLLDSIGEAYGYFGGVPLTSAVDNAKAAVSRAHRYDPDIHREFAHFCEHFGTAPLAMRPGKPKDKNLIENALGVFWRWARRRLRGKTFHSLAELNAFLADIADEFNTRIQRKYGASRRDKFETGERSKLLVMPQSRYNFGEWKDAKVHPDCHVQIGRNFYSVPYHLRGKTVEVRLTPALVEAYANLECVARHIRVHPNAIGRYVTKANHLPEAQRAVREATPQRAVDDAAAVGGATEAVVRSLIEDARHPLMHLRRVQGILRLAKRYSKPDLERACQTLVDVGTKMPRLGDVEALIKSKRDPKSASVIPLQRQPNPYLRGQDSWRLTQGVSDD
jgi:transposase